MTEPKTEGNQMAENTPTAPLEGLALLRAPFPAHQISQLPKGGIMLSYVGHAALTDRLLDADPCWNWEPLHIDPATGLPALDAIGGLWIKLTVCGVTRLGYGDAGEKKGCNAMKERIGDALRNAAMRFGAALDLWHKGELHRDDDQPTPDELASPDAGLGPARQEPAPLPGAAGATITPPQLRILLKALERKGLAEHALTDAFGIAALDQLPAASINDAIAWVSSQKAEDTPERDDDEAGDRI